MTKTWSEEPKERPTFRQIVEHLAEMTGGKQALLQQSDEHTYFAVDGLTSSSNHESEEDVGGVHVYMELASPLYKNFASRPEISVPPLLPEEYEVPVTAASRNMPQNCENGGLVVPMDYEVPVSTLPRSVDQQLNKKIYTASLTSSSGSDKQQLEESGQKHVYHTLEPPTRK